MINLHHLSKLHHAIMAGNLVQEQRKIEGWEVPMGALTAQAPPMR
jgi:hypothetical protein